MMSKTFDDGIRTILTNEYLYGTFHHFITPSLPLLGDVAYGWSLTYQPLVAIVFMFLNVPCKSRLFTFSDIFPPTKFPLRVCPGQNIIIYITISTFTSVRPYGVVGVTSHFQFLWLYHKMSLIGVAQYVLRVKNMGSMG